MKASKIIGALTSLFITFPIWFYLLYYILKSINAGELQWFLFWVYVPAHLVMVIITATVKVAEEG